MARRATVAPSGPFIVQTFVPASISCEAQRPMSDASNAAVRTFGEPVLTATSFMFTSMYPFSEGRNGVTRCDFGPRRYRIAHSELGDVRLAARPPAARLDPSEHRRRRRRR